MAEITTPNDHNGGLAAQLASLPDDVLAEVVREGEQMVESQFVAAQAADQRALALAGVAVTLSGAAVGLLLAGMPSSVPIQDSVVLAIVGLTAAALIVAATMAIIAAMPVRFQFPGNEPENWKPEHWSLPIRGKHTLHAARIEQALVLQAKIETNRRAIQSRALLVRRAIWIGFLSIGLAIFGFWLAYLVAALSGQS